MTGSGVEFDCHRRRRRTAAFRVLLVLVVGIGVQVGGWVVASGHPAVQATVILTAMAAVYVSAGLLLPVPPGGFLWAWQRVARERNAAARARGTSRYDGLDRLWFVSILVGVLPWEIFQSWVGSRTSDLTTVLLVTLGVALSGIAALFGVLEVRRRVGVRAAPQERPAQPDPPQVVVLQRRADREHGREPT